MNIKGKKGVSAYTDLNTGTYKVLFFRLIGGNYTVIDSQKVKINEDKFRYKNKDFINFNRNRYLFTDRKFNYFGFDYDSGQQIQFNTLEMPNNITLKEIDKYVNQGLIQQLALKLEKPKSDKSQWIWLIIGVVIGAMAGFIISNVISSGVVV